MPEEEKDVNTSETSTEEETQEVNTGEETAVEKDAQEDSSTQEETTPETDEGKSQEKDSISAFDESGIPWKNRFMEAKRKSDEIAEQLPEIIRSEFERHSKTTKEPKYSKEELRAFMLQADDPRHKAWAEDQLDKLRNEELLSEFESRYEAKEKKREVEIKKQQVFNRVSSDFPELFIKDSNGKPMSWDGNHPMTQEIGRLMQDPRLANDPDGLSVAAELAHSRYIRNQMSKKTMKEQKLKRDVKKLQKNVMVEGQGKNADTQKKTDYQKALSRFKETGSKQAATDAVSAYLKSIRNK